MKKRQSRYRKQDGFIAVIFAAVFLLAVVSGATALMSRGTGNATSDRTSATLADVLVKQTDDYRLGLERFLSEGRYRPADMTFDEVPGTGLFNTVPGRQYVSKHRPPSDALASGPGEYRYNKQVKLPGVANANLDDFVVVLGDVKLGVCRKVNQLLHKDTDASSIAVSSQTLLQWTSGGPIDDSGITAPTYAGRPEGCVMTSDGKYLYFKALVEN